MPGRRAGALLGAALIAAVAVGAASGATLVGSKSPNLLAGTKGADTLRGKAGGDVIKGRPGADRLIGGPGDDLLVGGRGRDRILGGPGADRLKASDGKADRSIDGGAGENACVIDIPLDLSVTTNCAAIRQGTGSGVGGAPPPAPNQLGVNSADGLLCLPSGSCLFTVTGDGAEDLAGTVTGGGAVVAVNGAAVNALVTGTWLATGTFTCAATGGAGFLVVTIGAKSTPQIPVDCG